MNELIKIVYKLGTRSQSKARWNNLDWGVGAKGCQLEVGE